MYLKVIKRLMDIVLAMLGLILLSWVYLIISIAVFLDDPGPVFFCQKRFGKNKKFFRLHKFRAMKKNAPHEVPTHLLKDPNQYITRVGRFLRRSSLDELPQIWDILVGHMSAVGPRPALWNQDDLIAERDKYGANDVRPGLTGLAQINGRDELAIPEKAKLDGEYTTVLTAGGLRAFWMDVKCFFGSFRPVATAEGVSEGKNVDKSESNE
jgi:O-antigen biosynthesis protein WbqP